MDLQICRDFKEEGQFYKLVDSSAIGCLKHSTDDLSKEKLGILVKTAKDFKTFLVIFILKFRPVL